MAKWANPNRQAHLVNIFLRSRGFCVFGCSLGRCVSPEHHHYEPFIIGLIQDWVAQDRRKAEAEWQAERRALHGLFERGKPNCQFDATAKDMFFARQPSYYLEGLGISGLTFRPFAKIRLASSFVSLHVDIADILRHYSKCKRRKAIRYGKLEKLLREDIDRRCKEAITDFQK